MSDVPPFNFTMDQWEYLESIKDGASSSFTLTGAALIFFMQAGFILVECAAIKKAHYSDVIVKNMLDSITGAIGFWLAGFAIAFGTANETGFFGIDGRFYCTRDIESIQGEDLWLKWFFQFAFVNTASTIVSGLLTERCRIEVYGIYSFLMSFIIYPVVAHWAWNENGWLTQRGYQDFAGSGVIHLLGGLSGLIGSVFCGPRVRKQPGKLQFPCLNFGFRRRRLAKFEEQERKKIESIHDVPEIIELLEDGKLTDQDVRNLQRAVLEEYTSPNFETETSSSVFLALGTFILYVGWFFFNGGSALSLYDSEENNIGKIIINTILGGAAGGAVAYFFKVPILHMGACKRQRCWKISHLYDAPSMCNGVLAGLVAVTASCNVIEPWAAIIIGIIGGFVYSFFVKLLDVMNIDDPVEASAVHYANGIWGLIACAIFDNHKGFISDYDSKGEYLGVQVYAAICISAWALVWGIAYFFLCQVTGLLKYHPAIEMMGVGHFKMGELDEKFKKKLVKEVEKHDTQEHEKDLNAGQGKILDNNFENQANGVGESMDRHEENYQEDKEMAKSNNFPQTDDPKFKSPDKDMSPA